MDERKNSEIDVSIAEVAAGYVSDSSPFRSPIGSPPLPAEAVVSLPSQMEITDDVDTLTLSELRARVRDYQTIIEAQRKELASISSLSRESDETNPKLSSVMKMKVFTDSKGLTLDRFSVQCVWDEDSDKWHSFEGVTIELCVDDTAMKMKVDDEEEEGSPDLTSYFAGVVEEVHLATAEMREFVRESMAVASVAEPAVAFLKEKSPSITEDIELLTRLREQDEKEADERDDGDGDGRRRQKSKLIGFKKKDPESIFASWAGDSALFTRGGTIRILKGITSAPEMVAADFYLKLRERWEGRRPVRVLALDGGGLRTAVSTQLVREIEKGAGGVPIHQCFDLIVGSSAGGLFAIELGRLGWKVAQADEFVEQLGREFFAKSSTGITALSKIFSEQELYETDEFREMVRKKFAEGMDSEDPPLRGRFAPGSAHCAVTSVRADFVPWRPFVFRSYDFGKEITTFEGTDVATVSEASAATTAAPLIMKPFQMKANRLRIPEHKVLAKMIHEESIAEFLDGGIYMNDPSLTGYFEAKQLFGYDKEVMVVSIGTGHLPKQYNQHQSTGWLKLGGTLAWGLFETKEVTNLQFMRQLLVEGQDYFRFDLTLERDENDKVSLIPYFRKRARAWLNKHEHRKAQLQALGRFFARYADEPLEETIAQDF